MKKDVNRMMLDIPGENVWRRDLTKDAAKLLVNWFNKRNEDATPTTPAEILEATVSFEASWKRHAGHDGASGGASISRDTHSQSQIDGQKLFLVNQMSENCKFDKYTEYERLPTTYKEANNKAYTIKLGRHSGQTIWDAFIARWKTDVDGTKLMQSQ